MSKQEFDKRLKVILLLARYEYDGHEHVRNLYEEFDRQTTIEQEQLKNITKVLGARWAMFLKTAEHEERKYESDYEESSKY